MKQLQCDSRTKRDISDLAIVLCRKIVNLPLDALDMSFNGLCLFSPMRLVIRQIVGVDIVLDVHFRVNQYDTLVHRIVDARVRTAFILSTLLHVVMGASFKTALR